MEAFSRSPLFDGQSQCCLHEPEINVIRRLPGPTRLVFEIVQVMDGQSDFGVFPKNRFDLISTQSRGEKTNK